MEINMKFVLQYFWKIIVWKIEICIELLKNQLKNITVQ